VNAFSARKLPDDLKGNPGLLEKQRFASRRRS